MLIEESAVFLLTGAGSAPKKAFGTGFAVAYRDRQLFILTCAHVVEQLDSYIRVSGQEAEVVCIGASDSIDLALLRIPCNDPSAIVNRTAKGEVGMKFQVCGYGIFSGAKGNYVLREIQGRLGTPILFESSGGDRVEAWDLHIDEIDNFSKLQNGYSGSPLCDVEGGLVAVVSHKEAEGRHGHALAVANLRRIYPQIEELIPSFPFLDASRHVYRTSGSARFAPDCKKEIDRLTNDTVATISRNRQPHILIVDDDKEWRERFDRCLSRDGYKISCANNKKEAVFILENKYIDLLCLNIILTGGDVGDGWLFDWTELLLEAQKKKKAVIVITGMNKGADPDFLIKTSKEYDVKSIIFKDKLDIKQLIERVKENVSNGKGKGRATCSNSIGNKEKDLVCNFIATDEIEEALAFLKKNVMYEKEAVLWSGRINRIDYQMRMGLLTIENANIERNNIGKSILDLFL